MILKIIIIVSDGDLITIFDSSDLTFAIQMSRSLKLCLLVPGKSGTVQPSAQVVRDVKNELRSLRDRINCLLDTLTDASPVASPAKLAPAAEEMPEYAAPAAPKEFDPLQDSGTPAANFSDNGTQSKDSYLVKHQICLFFQ
jgi:protein TFG